MIHKFLVTQTVTMIAVTIMSTSAILDSAIQCVLSVSQGTLHSVSPSRPLVLCQT